MLQLFQIVKNIIKNFFYKCFPKEISVRDTLEELIDDPDETRSETSLPKEERILLSNVLKLSAQTVEDVMIPRADIYAIERESSLDSIKALLKERTHSRMPVYKETIDDICGMVYLKDLFNISMDDNLLGKHSLPQHLIRPILFIAPSMPVLDLLLKMRKTRQYMAIIVDEFGGAYGLVTIEDLIEEIVGEIKDDLDMKREPVLVKQKDGSLIADARYLLEGFEKEIGLLLSKEERKDSIDTLGGLVFAVAGRVPARGELIEHSSGVIFEMLEVDPRRVKKLRIYKLDKLLSEDAYKKLFSDL